MHDLDDEVVAIISRHIDPQTAFHFFPNTAGKGGDLPIDDLRRAFDNDVPIGALFRATRDVLPIVKRNLATNLVIRELHQDLRYIPARLIGKETELYSEYDRVRSEAEFRVGIALPILALLGVVTWATGELLLLATIVLPLALIWEGLRRHRQANFILTEAVAAGRIEAPALAAPTGGVVNGHN